MRKKFLLTLLSVLILSAPAFAAFTNPPETDILSEKKGLGGRRMGDQAAVIMLVRNSASGNSSVSIVSGDAVVYDTVSDDGVSVRVTTTSADGAFAGIAVTVITSSDSVTTNSVYDDTGRRNWGYILVHGKCFANATASGTNGNSIGDILITSTDAGKVTTSSSNSTVTATGAEANKLVRGKGGFFYDAADTTSTVYEVQVEKE